MTKDTRWVNADGLVIPFGTLEGTSGIVGGYRDAPGGRSVLDMVLDLTKLTSTSVVQDYNTFVPVTAFIEQVDVEVIVAATSLGSATLNLGAYKSDTTTAISETAFINAMALSGVLDHAGLKTSLTYNATGFGAKIGAGLGFDGYISAKYGTAAFTAGLVSIRIYMSFPAYLAVLT